MGRLRGVNGVWLVSEGEMVDGLVGNVFGRIEEDLEPWVGGGLRVDFPYSKDEVREWILRALGRTKDGSAPGLDGIGY